MSTQYPIRFTLEDGVHVEVNKTGSETYDFCLRQKHGQERHFTLLDDDRPKDEIIDSLDFDQLNAVRAFWLQKDKLIL